MIQPIPNIPSSTLSSLRYVVKEMQVHCRWLDLVSSTLDYLRTAKSAARFLRDWSRPVTVYRPRFAADLLKPRFLIKDIVSRTMLVSQEKATALTDTHFDQLIRSHAIELTSFVTEDRTVARAFTAVGFNGLTAFLLMLADASNTPDPAARASKFLDRVQLLCAERECDEAVAKLVAEIDAVAKQRSAP